MTLRMIDTFSGIGGFSLAARWLGGIETVQFVEREPFCQRILAKHWPTIPIHDDISTFNPEPHSADIVCGGFPCQDISQAGKGAGLAGSRSGLFYELLRVVRLVGPRYIVLENVAAITYRGMDNVLGALAEAGYDAEWACIPAAAVGACHQRDRWWCVAYASGLGLPGRLPTGITTVGEKGGGRMEPKPQRHCAKPAYAKGQQRHDGGSADPAEQTRAAAELGDSGGAGDAAYANGCIGSIRWQQLQRSQAPGELSQRSENHIGSAAGLSGAGKEADAANSIGLRSQRRGTAGNVAGPAGAGEADRQEQHPAAIASGSGQPAWPDAPRRLNPDWRSYLSQPVLCRGDDGLSGRVDRLKALGNAVVPQVAMVPLARVLELEAIAPTQATRAPQRPRRGADRWAAG